MNHHRIPRILQPFVLMGIIFWFFVTAIFGLLAEAVAAAGAVEIKEGGWRK